jgi:hypothetical protein
MERRTPRLWLWLVGILLAAPAAARAASPETAAPPCAGPEFRRLDFWVGDWDAYEVSGTETSDKPEARCRVDVILGGCVLRETYEQKDGLVGQSFTIYDATRRVWHQSWVTNRGLLLTIEGTFEGDTLTLQGILRSRDAPEKTIRGIWRPEKGGVREIAQTSSDGGRTWQPFFDIQFRPHKNP